MNIKGKVTVKIPTQSLEDCNALMKSLSVDERGLPRGLTSNIRCDERVLVYELNFDIESDRLFSVYNTLDDLIRNAKVVLNSLTIIKNDQ